MVPGIAASPDKMLQGRLFSYGDTHRHRLGGNYALIPVNTAKATPVENYQRDGFMRTDDNFGGQPNYYPNSMGGSAPDATTGVPGLPVDGMTGRFAYTHPNDDYAQPRALFADVMTATDREHLIGNIAGHLGDAQERIQLRQTALFYRVHPEYGIGVATAIGLDVDRVKVLAGMTQDELVEATSA